MPRIASSYIWRGTSGANPQFANETHIEIDFFRFALDERESTILPAVQPIDLRLTNIVFCKELEVI